MSRKNDPKKKRDDSDKEPDIDPRRDIGGPGPAPVEEPGTNRKVKEPGKTPPEKK